MPILADIRKNGRRWWCVDIKEGDHWVFVFRGTKTACRQYCFNKGYKIYDSSIPEPIETLLSGG